MSLIDYAREHDEMRELRRLSELADLPELVADTHNTREQGGRTYGIIRAKGELVPLGSTVLTIEGMPWEQGHDRLKFVVAAVNFVRAMLASQVDESRELREALEPFAQFALEGKTGGRFIIAKGLFEDMKGWDDSPPRSAHLHEDDFRRARAVLEKITDLHSGEKEKETKMTDKKHDPNKGQPVPGSSDSGPNTPPPVPPPPPPPPQVPDPL